MAQGQTKNTSSQQGVRLRVAIRGVVQGVGFRPFVFRLASELRLTGWVSNSTQGVLLEVEGPKPELETFLLRLDAEKPPRSSIQSLEPSWLDRIGHVDFAIRESDAGGIKTVLVSPDIASCPDCLHETFDSSDRRYFYPFTNCTNCGPRFTIIESLPYDRANTSMKKFTMCTRCQAEYDSPGDRRFHAQPNACPVCGPHLELWDRHGTLLSALEVPDSDSELGDARVEKLIQFGRAPASMPEPNQRNFRALASAAQALRLGKIVAVKGLGGFHLMVAAHDEAAIRRLRELKHREEKPLALMFPSLASVKAACEVCPTEERLLRSAEAPILLLRAAQASTTAAGSCATDQPRLAIAPSVAPNNPFLGVLLPYTPLHHLLLSLVGFPVVATSGNLSDEPICTDEHEARERLGEIADLFLVHNRPIVRHVDDSIVRVSSGREQVLRRARGYAPLPVQLPNHKSEPKSVLAVGAHLKNSIALSVGSQVFISQHIGDLETEQANGAFRKVIADFEVLYESNASIVAADAHPDYLSTKFARALCEMDQRSLESDAKHESSAGPQGGRRRCVSVQHHLAHVLSCMAENQVLPPTLGIAWDGAGYGLDGTIWGGEFLLIDGNSWNRVAHFRQFRLPGGEAAMKEPRRTALGLLYEMLGNAAFANESLAPVVSFSRSESVSLKTMLERGINAPFTSSAGRLFDAVASLTGLRQKMRFEGQAAMELEFVIGEFQTDESYPVKLIAPVGNPSLRVAGSSPSGAKSGAGSPNLALQLDWSPLIQCVLSDVANQTPAGLISARFHNGLVEAMLQVALRCALERVILSGGCFQNQYLLEHTVQRLRQEGFRPHWHQRVPPNDGGICLGQVVAALQEFIAI